MTDPSNHPADLSRDRFAACLNTIFRVVGEPFQGLELELVRVSEQRASQHWMSFSIEFHGRAERLLEQHLYTLEHPAFGALDLFLVPIGKEQQGFLYEAVFNLMVPAGGPVEEQE